MEAREIERRGFTLIELLVVMVISAVLMLGLAAAWRQGYAVLERAENTREQFTQVRGFAAVMRQELGGVYQTESDPNEQSDGKVGFELLGGEKTELKFLTLTPCYRGGVEATKSGYVRYVYEGDGSGEAGEVRRYERMASGEKVVSEEVSDIVLSGVTSFGVEVFDGEKQQWRNAWPMNGELPAAVKVKCTLVGGGEESTAVEFVCSVGG